MQHRKSTSLSGLRKHPVLMGSTRSAVGSAMTTGMGIMEKGSFSVASKFSTPAIDKRSKKKNRVSVMDGQNGEQLREVSRILLVGTTMGH
jgi:hypothetical protein